jgi:hypothetical protein
MAFPLGVECSLGSVRCSQNGERDIVTYLEHVKPHAFIPNHVTAVAVEGSSLEWKVGFYDALRAAAIPATQWPDVSWIVDPNDYLRPLVYNLPSNE